MRKETVRRERATKALDEMWVWSLHLDCWLLVWKIERLVVQAILHFLDRHAVDPHIFFTIPEHSMRTRVELFWERKRTTKPWRLRSEDKERVEYCDYRELPEVLRRWGVSTAEVERHLRTVALTQVFFAQSLLEDATRVFGQREIDTATAEHREFLESLKQIVSSLVRKPLRAVSGQGVGGGRSQARLSLVAGGPQAKIG